METSLWLRYSYIFYLSIWLTVDAWTINQFWQCISLNRSPRIVRSLCETILGNLFVGDLIFLGVGLLLSWLILNRKQTDNYFAFTYTVYTCLTNFIMFDLFGSLIDYQQQKEIWNVGSPMGQALFVLLLTAIVVLAGMPYILIKAKEMFAKTE
jgi:hypothetical protein